MKRSEMIGEIGPAWLETRDWTCHQNSVRENNLTHLTLAGDLSLTVILLEQVERAVGFRP